MFKNTDPIYNSLKLITFVIGKILPMTRENNIVKSI